MFDLDELLTQVRSVIDKAIPAVQSVFLFTLFAGLVVRCSPPMQATRDERRYESAMRTLGASCAVVARGVLAEFTMLGLLSGLLAAAGASVAGWLLARYVLDILRPSTRRSGRSAWSAARCWWRARAGSPRARWCASRR